MGLDNIMREVTWGDVKALEPIREFRQYGDSHWDWPDYYRMTSQRLATIREVCPVWADWLLDQIAQEREGLTPNQRFIVASHMEDDNRLYNAASELKGLKNEQRWDLVKDVTTDSIRGYVLVNFDFLSQDQIEHMAAPMQDETWRVHAAALSPVLDGDQRFSLVRGLLNDVLLYRAAVSVPDLAPDQRYHLVDRITTPYYKKQAAVMAKGLSRQQKESLRRMADITSYAA